MNSAMGPIFNGSFSEKRSLWVPWIVYGTHQKATTATEIEKCASKKKKKRRRRVNVLSETGIMCAFGMT